MPSEFWRRAQIATRIIRRRQTGMPPLVGVMLATSSWRCADAIITLFGATVHQASRICSAAPPGGVLAASAVRDLALGKGFAWAYEDEATLKGFSEPVRVYRLTGREATEGS
jgi:class 3 adenylate cyclase